MADQCITKDICLESGTYKVVNHEPFDDRHPREIEVNKGDPFPSCSKCNKHVKYELSKKS